MPDGTLFGEATQALSSAGQMAESGNDLKEKSRESSMRSGDAASAQLGEDRRQQMTGDQAQKLQMLKSKMDQQENMIEITPQIALGLTKNTGDKEWMKAIGTKMRSDVVLGMYTHSIKAEMAKKAPRVDQVTGPDGKLHDRLITYDENGDPTERILEGVVPPKSTGKGKSGGGSDDTLKKQKTFMASHEKQAAIFDDPAKSAQLKATDPDQWNRQHEEYLKDQDQYDKLKTSLGSSGSSPATPGNDSGGNDSSAAPFDADALIHEALSNK